MARTLTADDAKQSLTAHVAAKGCEIFGKYGPVLGWPELERLLEDRAFVRYPCEIVFDAAALCEGEFAHPVPKGATPEAGFTMQVHPVYERQREHVPALVLYQLVAVNYGEFASADDAECFGAAALGLTRDEYYSRVCELAELVGGPEPAVGPGAAGGCGGCSCA
jgi:hypothetical protein